MNRRQPQTLTKVHRESVTKGHRPPVLNAPRPAATRIQHLAERDAARAKVVADDGRAPHGPVPSRGADRAPLTRSERWIDVVIATALAGAAFVLYARTAARYPTTGDTPELMAVANVLGVAHAPGYPLLTMTAHLFGAIPLGSYALRLSLYAATCSALTVAVVYLTVRRLTTLRVSAVVAAVALAVTPVFWQLSVVFEVFAPANLLAVVLAYLLVRWYQAPERARFLIAAAFAFGLAMSNQQTIVFIVPAVLWLVWSRRTELTRRVVGSSGLALVAGLLPYVYVPFAAARHPAMNWDDAHSAAGFYRLVTRAGYGSKFELVGPGALSGGNPLARFGYLLVAITVVLGPLAIAGLVYAYRNQRWYFWFSLVAFAFAGALFQIPANISTNRPDTALFVLQRFFLLPIVLLAPLAGLGVSQLGEWASHRVSQRGPVTAVVAIAALSISLVLAVVNFDSIDLSRDRVADNYARDILGGLPQNDVLIANGDETIGPLWYVHYVEHVRPDVSIVLSSGIAVGWYDNELRAAGLSVPAHPTMLTLREANSKRPFDYVGPVGNDGSMNGKYYVYRNGLTYNILPEAVDKSPDQLVADNTAKLAAYHIPTIHDIKKRSFESTIVADYAYVPFGVGDQFHSLKQDDQALVWYQKALDIDPGNATIENAINALKK